MTTSHPEFDPEFDHVYAIDASGALTGDPAAVPDVTHDPDGDVTTPGDWVCLTGYTAQHGYRGAVMHPSELWTPAMLDELQTLADNGVPGARAVFAVVEVRDEDGSSPDSDPIGWAVAYRVTAE